MNLCSDGHDEVCYEGRKCPACKEIAKLDAEIHDLKRENEAKENEIEELKQQGENE